MDLYTRLGKLSKKKNKTIIFPESYDERVNTAVKIILKEKLAKIILISERNIEHSIAPDKNLTIIDEAFSSQFLRSYHAIKTSKKKDYELSKSESDIRDPLTFSCILLKNNYADGIIAGSVYSSTEVIRNAISIIGVSKNNKTVSSFFLFTFPEKNFHHDKVFAYADCGVIPFPDAEQLSDIAIQTANSFKKLTGIRPRVAFLSFSTKGSAKDESINKILKAYELTKINTPSLVCDAELQFDAAFVKEVAARKNPLGKIKGDANVFIFPDLNSGNIAYKITERIGGATATGPILQGLSKPVMDLSRGCKAEDIINMTKVISNL
ncbi:MAG: phosphotransacetylase [Ignavibacteria bacterium]